MRATFCRNQVADPVQSTRSASTVAGINGVASSRTRTRCSNGAKLVTTGGREYAGGLEDATAFATVFLETPKSLAICAFGTRSLRCSRRINAQSSKVITSPSWVGAHSSSVTSAQFSSVIDRALPAGLSSGERGRPETAPNGLLDSEAWTISDW